MQTFFICVMAVVALLSTATVHADPEVECSKSQSRELGRRFPAIMPAQTTECFTFNSDDMLSFGTVKVMMATNSALEVFVAINEEWVPATLIRADQNSQGLEASVSPGDINAQHNNTLRVAVRNADSVAVPFSLVTLLPLPSCDYERVTLSKETSVRLSRPNCYVARVEADVAFQLEQGNLRLTMPPGMMLYVASSVTYIRDSGKRVDEKYAELPPVWAANQTQVVYDTAVNAGSQSEIEFVVLPLNHLIDGEEREEARITFALTEVLECAQHLPAADLTNEDTAVAGSDVVASYTSYEVEAKVHEPTCFTLPVENDAAIYGGVFTRIATGIEHSSDLRLYYRSTDSFWRRIFRSEQASDIVDDQSVTEYKVPSTLPPKGEPDNDEKPAQKFVRVMVNIQPEAKDADDAVQYTIDFRKPELRCDEPEMALLGKLEPGEPVHSDRPVCYRINIVQGNKRGNGIMLRAAFTGDADALQPLKLFTSDTNTNQWTAMDVEAGQSPRSRTFLAATSEDQKEMDVMVVSTSNSESQYMVMFDTEAPRQHATEAAISCPTADPAPFGHAIQTSLDALQTRCFNFSISQNEELFDAVRITIRCEETVKVFSKTVVVKSEPDAKAKRPSAHHGGLLGLLEHLKQQFEGQEASDWNEGDKSTEKEAFWTPVIETASANSLHMYRYNLVHAFKAMSVDKEVRVAMSLSPPEDFQPEAITGAATPASIQFDLASPRCSFPTRVPLGVSQVGSVVGGEQAATTCYFVALTKEQLQHSDRVMVKVSPASAALSMGVFVESLQSRGDDRLTEPKVQGDTATFEYCAAREPNHALASCRRKPVEKDQMPNLLLRVTLVATIPARVGYSVAFETIGPSCKFPVMADHTGDYEYRLSISNKMHLCYQLAPTPVDEHHSSHSSALLNSLVDTVKGKKGSGLTSVKVPKVEQNFYHVHIELDDPSETEVLELLRVYGKSKTGDEWVQLEPLRSSDSDVVYRLEYTSTAEGLGIGDQTQQLKGPEAVKGLSEVLAARLKTLNKALQSPSWVTVTVLSPDVHNFRIWFSDAEERHKTLSGNEDVGSGMLSIIIGAIVVCFAGLIGAIVCCFKGAQADVKYARLDQPQQARNGGDEEEEDDAGDIEMDVVADSHAESHLDDDQELADGAEDSEPFDPEEQE